MALAKIHEKNVLTSSWKILELAILVKIMLSLQGPVIVVKTMFSLKRGRYFDKATLPPAARTIF
jgi:hypothetical protein